MARADHVNTALCLKIPGLREPRFLEERLTKYSAEVIAEHLLNKVL